MKTLLLAGNENYVSIIDDEDSWVFQYNWWAWEFKGCVYAGTTIQKRKVKLQNLLLPSKPGFLVDHKNRNTLDNRRENLRYATKSQNNANSFRPRTLSGFRGVYPQPQSKNWYAAITYAGKRLYIGTYSSKEEAARAYDEIAVEKFGEFATQNFKC